MEMNNPDVSDLRWNFFERLPEEVQHKVFKSAAAAAGDAAHASVHVHGMYCTC
jgi:hypothetical protein